MQDILEEINRITKGNVIFTGSYSEKIQGVPIEKVGDLDIIVKDSTPFQNQQRFKSWKSNTAYSKSGKRATFFLKGKLIDVFIEESFPRYILIDGFKFETVNSMYNWSLSTVGRVLSMKYKIKLRNRIFRLKSFIDSKI